MIVGCGSFAGGALRYAVSRMVAAWCAWLPAATMTVNVVGCLLIGLFCGLAGHGQWMTPNLRLFLTVGFCGGFTTFSTFMNENMHLLRLSDFAGACLNIVVSLVAGFAALYAGYQAARLF